MEFAFGRPVRGVTAIQLVENVGTHPLAGVWAMWLPPPVEFRESLEANPQSAHRTSVGNSTRPMAWMRAGHMG